MYRGYDIADLAEHATYEEVAYLLLEGELPNGDQLGAFREELGVRDLPGPTAAIVDGRSQDAAPMEMLRTAVSSLSREPKPPARMTAFTAMQVSPRFCVTAEPSPLPDAHSP